jgi:hypothetical protein
VIADGDMLSAATLAGHTYIIIEESDDNGLVKVDKYKLLPPDGSYKALVNGVNTSVNLCNNAIQTDVKSKKVVIEL